jgi:hypothetical protein
MSSMAPPAIELCRLYAYCLRCGRQRLYKIWWMGLAATIDEGRLHTCILNDWLSRWDKVSHYSLFLTKPIDTTRLWISPTTSSRNWAVPAHPENQLFQGFQNRDFGHVFDQGFHPKLQVRSNQEDPWYAGVAMSLYQGWSHDGFSAFSSLRCSLRC